MKNTKESLRTDRLLIAAIVCAFLILIAINIMLICLWQEFGFFGIFDPHSVGHITLTLWAHYASYRISVYTIVASNITGAILLKCVR